MENKIRIISDFVYRILREDGEDVIPFDVESAVKNMLRDLVE